MCLLTKNDGRAASSPYPKNVQTYVGDGTDAFGYAGLDTVSERIVVAFKGTSDLRDWVSQ